MSRIAMGIAVQDVISGLTGIVTGQVRYITGCDQYQVQPRSKDGSRPEAQWIDEARLAIVNNDAIELPFAAAAHADPDRAA